MHVLNIRFMFNYRYIYQIIVHLLNIHEIKKLFNKVKMYLIKVRRRTVLRFPKSVVRELNRSVIGKSRSN